MTTQKFKGDETELKMDAVCAPSFDRCSAAFDLFFDGTYSASDFLLALYDNKRVPFTERIPQDTFVAFFKEALNWFPFTGSFESYIFILKSIFGEETEIDFEVTAPGKLSITIDAQSTLGFGFIVTEIVDGSEVEYDLVTSDGFDFAFTQLPGIDSEAAIEKLISEIIPNGIFPTITFRLFTVSFFIAEEADESLNSVIDSLGNQIVFFELV